jgi:hypothetical protein
MQVIALQEKAPVIYSKRIVAAVLVLFCLQSGWIGSIFAQEVGALRIAVVQGENQVVKKDKSLRLVVEVRNYWKAPVVGADVTFTAPESGPGLLFAGNVNQLTVKTDSFGKANPGITRSVGDGPFAINIVASYRGQTVSTSAHVVNQTSSGSASAGKKKSPLKWILIAAGGGAAGAFVATRKSNSGGSGGGSGGPGSATITAGPPTVGAPQ